MTTDFSRIILDPPAEIHEILCFARSRHIHHPPKLITGRLRRAEDQGLVQGLVAVQGRAKPQGAIQSWLLHQVSFEDVKKYEQSVAVITRRRMARERRRACYSVVSSIRDIVGESFIEDDADDQQKGDRNAMSMSDSKQK